MSDGTVVVIGDADGARVEFHLRDASVRKVLVYVLAGAGERVLARLDAGDVIRKIDSAERDASKFPSNLGTGLWSSAKEALERKTLVIHRV